MAINPNTPNSISDINRYSQAVADGVDAAFGRLGRLTVKDVLGGNILDRSLQRNLDGKTTSVLLESLINDLDRPILKGLLLDSITVVGGWFDDPKILCCLIQGIWAMYAATYSNTDLARLQREGIAIADSDFGKWLDLMIAFVDLIITFIGTDLKKISIMLPDLIKEIMNGVIGAILLILQQVLFAIRDSAIAKIIEEIDRAANEGINMSTIWAKCIPFAQLLDVIKKYITDYGLFAELFEKIKGFVSGKVGDFSYTKALNFPKSAQDLEFLYWFRDLLIKLKQAALNFDLCVNYAASPGGNAGIVPPDPDDSGLGDGGGDGGGGGGGRDVPTVPGLKLGPDGTILSNRDTQQEQRDNILPVLSNSSIRGFLNKYYGLPLDVVDNLLVGASPADSIQGTNINAENLSAVNADCPNSPSPEEIVKWALRIKNRNL